MSSTNKTPYTNLSQFVDTDRPTWRGDYNGDMSKIDTAIQRVDNAATTAQTALNNHIRDANERFDAIHTELDAKANTEDVYSKSDSDSKFLTKTSAESKYLAKTDADETYLKKSDAATQYTTKNAFDDYKLSNNTTVNSIKTRLADMETKNGEQDTKIRDNTNNIADVRSEYLNSLTIYGNMEQGANRFISANSTKWNYVNDMNFLQSDGEEFTDHTTHDNGQVTINKHGVYQVVFSFMIVNVTGGSTASLATVKLQKIRNDAEVVAGTWDATNVWSPNNNNAYQNQRAEITAYVHIAPNDSLRFAFSFPGQGNAEVSGYLRVRKMSIMRVCDWSGGNPAALHTAALYTAALHKGFDPTADIDWVGYPDWWIAEHGEPNLMITSQ